MTAPHVLSPEEWEAQSRPLSPEEWEMAQRAKARFGTGGLPLPTASADVTREVGGVADPEAWKATIHKPGFIERNVTGAIGLPFAAAAHPIETAGAMLKSVVTDPFKPGMYVAKKLNQAVGLPAPSDRFNVSGEEAAQSALNTAFMIAPALLKAVRGAPVEAPIGAAAPARVPRPGIGRIPAAEVTPRTGPVSGLAELLDDLRQPESATGDVPANVPFPPAQRAYPLGATTGDLLEGGVRKPFREPLPTPYAREGIVRRPASRVPSPQEWEAAQQAPPEAPAPAPAPAPLRPAVRPTLGPPKVTAEMMLAEGKRRAAELEKEPGMPDLAPAMEREPNPPLSEGVSFGRDLGEPGRMPAEMPSVPRPRGTDPSGVMQTPEGVVSAGPKALPERTTTDAVAAEPAPELAQAEGARLPTIEGTGEAKPRGLASGVEAKAVANKLTDSLGGLPEYRTVNMAEQAAKATKLLAEDAERARRIALGHELPPADVLPESVFTAVENKAIAEGDVGTLRDLASGELTTQATTMGQRIRALAERSPESPVAAIQKVIEARVRGAKNAKAATMETVKSLQQHIADAVKMDPQAWTSFIDSLRC